MVYGRLPVNTACWTETSGYQAHDGHRWRSYGTSGRLRQVDEPGATHADLDARGCPATSPAGGVEKTPKPATPLNLHVGPVPPIPAACAHRPTIGGLVRPWVNVELADGGLDFRSQHRARAELAITKQLCQVCGRPLHRPNILLGGPDQLRTLTFSEPPLHAECAVYTSYACPMVAGRMDHVRTTAPLAQGPRGAVCATPGCDCGGWVSTEPADVSTETPQPRPWYALYTSGYTSVRDQHGKLLAITSPAAVLRVRLVSRPGEGRVWVSVADALKDYEAPTFLTPNTATGMVGPLTTGTG